MCLRYWGLPTVWGSHVCGGDRVEIQNGDIYFYIDLVNPIFKMAGYKFENPVNILNNNHILHFR